LITVLFATSAAGPGATALAGTRAAATPRPLRVSSTAFTDQQAIPAEYTCEGAQKAPPLAWSAPPRGTKSIAIFVEDPDASSGAFTHWLVTGIPPAVRSLPAGGSMPKGAMAARNSTGDEGYAAPCPPFGPHRYHFHVYALDTEIAPPASKHDFLSVIEGHVLAEGELVGAYEKAPPPWLPLVRRVVEAFDDFLGAPA
jgi:Raf kinase inhibitor-like YbhB/YbcL family protein